MESQEGIRLGSAVDPFDRPQGEVVRFAMDRALGNLPPEHPMPFGYRIEPWCEPMLPAYGSVLAVAFADSPDLEFYPRLASREGCTDLIEQMTSRVCFLTGGTWLVLFNREPAAMIISSRSPGKDYGRIDVVAVAPRHRRIGVGAHLAYKAMWAFYDRHLPKAVLRVNRPNRGAVRFFRSLGFQVRTSSEVL